MIDRQLIFTTATAAIITQGAPSYDPDQGCLYRGPNNTRCALGHLIADEDYDSAFENHIPQAEGDDGVWPNGIRLAQVLGAADSPNDAKFLRDLQGCHDNAARAGSDFLAEFRTNCAAFADEHGLTFNA